MSMIAHVSPSTSKTISVARFLLPSLLPFQALTSSISADKSLLAIKSSYCSSTGFLKEGEVHAAVNQEMCFLACFERAFTHRAVVLVVSPITPVCGSTCVLQSQEAVQLLLFRLRGSPG
eukprot:evm.model.NODE_23125_length_7385_cov_31.993635.4